MQIHIVTDRFTVGGGIEHIYQVVKGLAEFNFSIFGKPGNAVQKFEKLDNVKVYSEGYHPRYVMAEQPDLVHIHHLKPLFSFFRTPFKSYNVPVIFTAHGLHIHKYEFLNTINNKIKYSLRFFLEKIILKKPGKIIAVSKEDREFLEKSYHLKNVLYLTNGIDFEKIRSITASKEDLRKQLGLPIDDFLCVTTARFNYQKGYDILIEAIERLKRIINLKEAKMRFLFIGNGPEFEKMKAKSSELSNSGYVSFLGERKDVYNIVKACDLFVLTSRWEGLPIVLLETGLLKTPALASETYGNREILKGGKGILFRNEDSEELANSLRDIIEGKYDLNRYAQDLFKEVETNYNLEKMINGLRKIYKSYI
jgi:glycosyltransferase involved in cell wall biosynthesis